MAIPPAPLRLRARDRAGSRSDSRYVTRWVIRVLLLAGALLGISTPAMAATHASHGLHGSSPAAHSISSPAKLAAEVTPALPGGVCQVPGIGDIGGLAGPGPAASRRITGRR